MNKVQMVRLTIILMLVTAEGMLVSSASSPALPGQFYYMESGRYIWAGGEPLRLGQTTTAGPANLANLGASGTSIWPNRSTELWAESIIGSLAYSDLGGRGADSSILRGPFPVALTIYNPFRAPSWYDQVSWSFDYQKRHWSQDLFGDTDYIRAIEEFRQASWRPVHLGYGNHIPALGEFIIRSPGQGAPLDYSQHVPAIQEFLSDDWSPASPPDSQTSPGLAEFLRD